jgi:serine/threonine protein kinase
LPSLSSQDEFVRMFLREAQVAAKLSHPNVVQILDFGKVQNLYYISMEYVRGCDLNHIIRTAKILDLAVPPEIAARIVADACAGLSAAHTFVDEHGTTMPIVHRDISPHNVLVGLDGTVKLADFGIAKASDSITQTSDGAIKGKLSFVAPERALGVTLKIDPRSDLFSMGVVLYQLLTSTNPFTRENELATLKAVTDHQPPPVISLRADVSPVLDAVVARALQKNPDDRYQTARQFQLDLESAELGGKIGRAEIGSWLTALFKAAEGLAPVAPGMAAFTPSARAPTGSTVVLSVEARDEDEVVSAPLPTKREG